MDLGKRSAGLGTLGFFPMGASIGRAKLLNSKAFHSGSPMADERRNAARATFQVFPHPSVFDIGEKPN
jgi:hypothetical protein